MAGRRAACSVDAPDLRAQPRQLALDVLVAAVEVVDAVDDGLALGDQAGEDQRGRGAQVGRHHRGAAERGHRSEEHTSELQSLMRISYAVFCLKKKTTTHN